MKDKKEIVNRHKKVHQFITKELDLMGYFVIAIPNNQEDADLSYIQSFGNIPEESLLNIMENMVKAIRDNDTSVMQIDAHIEVSQEELDKKEDKKPYPFMGTIVGKA